MAFDTPTRNALARLTADARSLLVAEVTRQLQSSYGIQPTGQIIELDKLTHLDDEQRAVAGVLRERIHHLVAGGKQDKKDMVEAVDRVIREQSFTILNRFAALRMCEERGIVQQCVGAGVQSKGFQVYLQTAGSGLGEQYDRYRTYLFCIFDEIAVDLGILFDRYSAYGLLFPGEPALMELLEIVNRKELAHVWAEDEAIGWIYQYFNSKEERQKMRKESAAPRNSRELAVRNQFFTPRYVVEFLSDNTLGRIWYEMTQGQTRLKDQCRYMVRRPNEIFLAEGESAPTGEEETKTEELSQEELLKKPVYIPHRPIKDPREIRMLDPACGSMHFGLYCFDLYETIYEEAWHHPIIGKKLQADFQSLEEYRRQIPRLIIEHNIHGIDIDPRCAQIAGLSLWLRAQKAWKQQGIKNADRPLITKSNVVCAEPMPGDKELLKAFTATLNPPLLGQIVEKVWEAMQLAGEAGSLLKIEEQIADWVKEAKLHWKALPKASQMLLFESRFAYKTRAEQEELKLDLTGISDEAFWEQAEERIYAALEEYSAKAAALGNVAQRLFAEDAARGFAFIDVCRKRFDAVVMNPPFGELAENTIAYIKMSFGDSSVDIYTSFVSRADSMSNGRTLIGAIIPRSLLYYIDFYKFRENELYGKLGVPLCAELGLGVLDGATVRTIVSIFQSNPDAMTDTTTLCNRIVDPDKWETGLQEWAASPVSGQIRSLSEFEAIPGKPLLLALSSVFVDALVKGTKLDPISGKFHSGERTGAALIVNGLQTCDDFRFIRTWAEVSENNLSESWLPLLKATDYLPYEGIAPLVVDWDANGAQIKEFIRGTGHSPSRYVSGEEHYPTCGVWYPGVCERGNCAAVIYGRSIPSRRGIAVIPQIEDMPPDFLSGVLNSIVGCGVVGMVMPDRYRNPSYVGLVPVPSGVTAIEKVSRLAERIRSTIGEFCEDELSARFLQATLTKTFSRSRSLLDAIDNWMQKRRSAVEQVENTEAELDAEVLQGIGILPSDREILKEFSNRPPVGDWFAPALTNRIESGKSLGQYLLGSAFGRWDIRYATGERQPPELPDPCDPLPVCPPGMLQNAEGLPAEPKDVPADYPLRISWPGILADDEGHTEDIMGRIREAIAVIWKDSAEVIELEACEILGVKKLRDFFAEKKSGGKFFADHLSRYSKSRRQAPIYWPLSTESGSYTLWIYYHRLDDQMLFKCVTDFLEPKIRDVSRDIERLQKSLAEGGTAEQRDELDALLDFRIELEAMKTELLRVARLPYKPDLNDGVIINTAPLWKLFRLKKWQIACKDCWEKLEAGDYDWAHMAYHIWPDRVREKCKTDKSLAIAHDLENLYVEPPSAKKKRKKRAEPEDEVELIEAEE
jgi:hypothetical protein